MRSWAYIGLAGSFGALLVGACGARAVSRKTPIYFMIINQKMLMLTNIAKQTPGTPWLTWHSSP